ncbi:MAG: cyclic nucleotide-binding domain-containing protein [Fibrobacterota bacterium]
MKLEKDVVTIMEDVIFLKSTEIFSEVKSEDLRILAAIAQDRNFSGGDNIIYEGEYGDSMFIVKSGTVRIVKNGGDGKQIKLADLKSRACFGEMVIFDDSPRSAGVVAADECVLLEISRDDIFEIILEHPTIALNFLKISGMRIRNLNNQIIRKDQQ